MTCNGCGATNSPKAKFCSECGSPLQHSSASQVSAERVSIALVAVSCPVCGGPIKPEASQCGYCGSVIVIKLDMPRINPDSLKMGVIDQHIKEFRGRVRRDANDEEAHYGLGIAYYNLGLIDEAISQLEEAVRLMPENANIQLQLALLFGERIEPRQSGTGWGEAARKSLYRVDRALILQPYMLDALLFRASLYSDMAYVNSRQLAIEDYLDDFAVAIDCWQSACKLNPDSIRTPISKLLRNGSLPSRIPFIVIPSFADILGTAPQFNVTLSRFGRNREQYLAAMNEYNDFLDGRVADSPRLIEALRYVHADLSRRTRTPPPVGNRVQG